MVPDVHRHDRDALVLMQDDLEAVGEPELLIRHLQGAGDWAASDDASTNRRISMQSGG